MLPASLPAIYLSRWKKALPPQLEGTYCQDPIQLPSTSYAGPAHRNSGLLVHLPLSADFLVLKLAHRALPAVRILSRSLPPSPPARPCSLLPQHPFLCVLCQGSRKSSLLGSRMVMTPWRYDLSIWW